MDEVILDIPETLGELEEYEGIVSPSETPLFRPIPYHLRFTFSNQDKELECLKDKQFIARAKTIHKRLIEKMRSNEYFHQGKFTSGFEIRNKLGENCRAHIHICFFSTHVKQSMDRCIKRYLQDNYDETVVGNQAKMFKEVTQLRDTDEHYRYAIKQTLNRNVCGGFTDEYLLIQHEIAKETYGKIVQVNQKKMDAKDKTDTLFSRVMLELKKDIPTNMRQVAKAFLNLYIEEDRPINKQTIQGYCVTAGIKLNLINPDELLTEWGY